MLEWPIWLENIGLIILNFLSSCDAVQFLFMSADTIDILKYNKESSVFLVESRGTDSYLLSRRGSP